LVTSFFGTQCISAFNGEKLIIDGVTRVRLSCSGRKVATSLYVAPDISGVIVGIDWLQMPGTVWDFGNPRIKIKDSDWIPLSTHKMHASNEIYAADDTVLSPKQESTVTARLTWRRPKEVPTERMNESI